VATPSIRPATSARARTARTSTDPALSTETTLAALRDGELELVGRLVGSSNNAMVVRVRPPVTASPASPPTPATSESVAVELEPGELLAVWKPTRGEQPLFDFPVGTLTRREVAAYLVSEATGWGIVPPTLLREGPYGEGSLQQWIDVDEAVDVVQLVLDADPRLRRIALFDAIVNNTDRKGGHLLPIPGGHIHAVDHGVTFSVVPKLRTLLWAWEGEPLESEEVAVVDRVRRELDGQLGADLRELLYGPEVDATRERVAAILASGVFPGPNPDWPAIPWPPF
jgi:uncharacterized repeat protein (TIGR03843 family)